MRHTDYVMASDLQGQFVIGMAQWTVGPHHDPYAATTLEVERGSKTAEWYADGFGTVRVRFYEKQDGKDILLRELDFVPDGGNTALTKLKAELLFKNFVGIRHDAAEVLFHLGYEPDPMGHSSRYE